MSLLFINLLLLVLGPFMAVAAPAAVAAISWPELGVRLLSPRPSGPGRTAVAW